MVMGGLNLTGVWPWGKDVMERLARKYLTLWGGPPNWGLFGFKNPNPPPGDIPGV